MNLCTMGHHSIPTSESKPSHQFNNRILIHFKPLIDEEINKLLKLGIIVKGKSKWCSRLVPVIKPNG